MSKDTNRQRPRAPWRVGTALVLSVALTSCGLDEVNIPELDGPSTFGLSLVVTASTDVLVADGRDSAVITATLRGPNGQPVQGRDVFFAIADEDGTFADIGVLVGQNGPGTGATIRTGADGAARIVYEAPPRTDATAHQTVLVMARLIGVDANAAVYHSVRIELRSAEPRMFPPNPSNIPPECNFIVEAPGGLRTNTVIIFNSTSFDEDGVIVRYEWDFGDGGGGDRPDTAYVYRVAGSYTVLHQVTDDDGGQAACATGLTIIR